jgi:hypothetical protein
MKSMPPSTSFFTSLAVWAGSSPMLGLMIVPMTGPCAMPVSFRVPAIPKAGPGQARAKAAGSFSPVIRRPETCLSSNRLPAMVASRLGSEGPILPSGQDSSSRQRRFPDRFQQLQPLDPRAGALLQRLRLIGQRQKRAA